MPRTDIPFATDDTQRFLPWLSGIMIGLAAFLLCLGLSLNHWVIGKQGAFSGHFTVNIPAGERQADHAVAAVELLEKTPGIARTQPVSERALREMLSPWMGGAPMDDLPLPIVIEATLENPSAPVDYEKLQRQIAVVAPGAEIDAHERWTSAFADFSAALGRLTQGLALLVTGALAMTVFFTSRASLKLHNQAVHLLHSIGAEDDYIVRQFQREAVRVILPGAALGCILAALLYWTVGSYIASLRISMLPPLAMTGGHALLLIAMPVVCALAAWLVARFSISLQLRRVL